MLLQILQSVQGASNASTIIYAATAFVLLLSSVLSLAIQNGNTSTTRRKLRNSHRFGLPPNSNNSNMTDQYDSKYAAPEDTTVNGPIRIKAIYIHPVKSCGYIEVNRASLTKAGFLYDRYFALATNLDKDAKWRFISQRTKPGMAKIKTELWLPGKGSSPRDPLVQAGGCVVSMFPDPDVPSWINQLEAFFHTGDLYATPEVSVIVPLQPTSAQDESLKTFTIHYRDTKGLDMANVPSVAATLPKSKRFLGIKNQNLTFSRCTPESLNHTDRNSAPLKYIGSPAIHGYTDQQPVNINNLSSIHAVSALLPPENQPLNALRFRANIWFIGAPSFAEETWKRYRILSKSAIPEPRADVSPTLSVVCRTSRCTIPNVNPDTGTFDADIPPPEKKNGKPQPSTTLVEHRTVETGNKQASGYIGMHCVPEDRDLKEAEEQKEGSYVEVGDEIEVLETGEHSYGSTTDEY